MKQYIEPEIALIELAEPIAVINPSENNQGSGTGDDSDGGHSMAPANPGWLDHSNRFFGDEDDEQ